MPDSPGLSAEHAIDFLSAHRAAQKSCLIDPRSSKFLRWWDATVALCLIYTALVTPYEVAFLPPPTSALSVIFLINRVIDILFLLDMAKEFVVMYEDTTGTKLESKLPQTTTEVAEKKKRAKKSATTYVADHGLIAKHYFSSWFAIDLVSVLTSAIDIISLTSADVEGATVSETAASLNQLRLLKVLRVLRLIKLVRLLKSTRLFERWQASIELDFSSQTVIKVLTLYLLCGHWFACILVLSSSFSYPMYSWRGAKGFCIDGANHINADSGELELPLGREWERLAEGSQIMNPTYVAGVDVGIYCVIPNELWIASYYWMIMLISGAAGGDTNCSDIYPAEQLVFTALVVMSALVWSQIIASFCDVLSNLNPEHAAFRQRVDNLNRYCRANRFDVATRRRLREYLYRAKHVQVEESQRELLLLMSPKLQGELSLQVTGSWLTTVRFLQHVEAECVVQVALSLSPAVFVPTERISANYLYQLQRGTVINRGRVVVGDEHWGKECILERQDLRAKPAVALSYAEVSRIHRDQLIEIIHETAETSDGKYNYTKYPKALRKIKWEAVRLAVVRMLLLMAIQETEQEGGGDGAPPGPGIKRQGTLSPAAKKRGAWGNAMMQFGDELTSVEEIETQREENEKLEALKKVRGISTLSKGLTSSLGAIGLGKSSKSPDSNNIDGTRPSGFGKPPAPAGTSPNNNTSPPTAAAGSAPPGTTNKPAVAFVAFRDGPAKSSAPLPNGSGPSGGSFAGVAKGGAAGLSVNVPTVSPAAAGGGGAACAAAGAAHDDNGATTPGGRRRVRRSESTRHRDRSPARDTGDRSPARDGGSGGRSTSRHRSSTTRDPRDERL